MDPKLPFEDELLNLKPHEQHILIIRGRMFVVRPATDDDFDEAQKAFECWD